MRTWRGRLVSAQRQARSWRLAALGSASIYAALGLAMAISASRAQVIPYIVEVEILSEMRTAIPQNSTPSDAQIAYFLARFVKNVRSLSTDPIVVRTNWLEALNYVTDSAAQMLNSYARDANHFTNVGLRAKAVEVVYLVRASENSFEVRWKEETFESGTVTKSERLTGLIEIAVEPASEAEALRNPLGLYVQAFAWSVDYIQMRGARL